MPKKGMIHESSTLKYLFGKNRLGLLDLFFRYPHKSCYVNEPTRQLYTGSGAVQRELAAIAAAGIVPRLLGFPIIILNVYSRVLYGITIATII